MEETCQTVPEIPPSLPFIDRKKVISQLTFQRLCSFQSALIECQKFKNSWFSTLGRKGLSEIVIHTMIINFLQGILYTADFSEKREKKIVLIFIKPFFSGDVT